MSKQHRWLKGQLLLDGGKLAGSAFHRAVVLICQHDAQGAFGLVLNQGSGRQVGDGLTAELGEALKEQEIFIGGPVQPGALSYLHTAAFMPDANVMPGLSLGHSLDELTELGNSWTAETRAKVFAGYAGWSPGQLEDEMKRESWLTHPASLDLVFDADPATLWQRILRSKGWQYRLLADAPEDLSWN